MDLTQIIGFVASLCSVTSFVPQAWKVIRTRDASGISTRMYVLTVVGFSLWLTYGIMLGSWPLMLANGTCLLLSAFILAMKVMGRRVREQVAESIGA